MLRSLALLVLTATTLHAQDKPTHAPAVLHWYNPGAILVPSRDAWALDFTNIYDDGTRPVLQLSDKTTGITASIMLFDNYYKKPDPEGCRKDATDGVVQHEGTAITDRRDFTGKSPDGLPLAFTSWVLHSNPASIRQRNLFAFASDAANCYEVHVSKMESRSASGKPLEAELQRALQQFRISPAYQPDAMDYFVMASLLYKKTPLDAAPYYKEALKRMPAGVDLTQHRILTDQLVMSLGMGGDLKSSRAVAQQAIESDPDYPLNYYNLACADAEEGNAAGARAHLEQAFARKQNTLKGERLPDPDQDDSFQKLKTDKDFRAYLQTLH